MEKSFANMLEREIFYCKLMMPVTAESKKESLRDMLDTYYLCNYILNGWDFPEPIDRKKALNLIQSEIQLLKDAPKINGCKMTPEWAEMIEFYKTCEKLLKGEYRDDTTRSE